MRQEVDNLERLAVDYVLDGDLHLRAIQAELAKIGVKMNIKNMARAQFLEALWRRRHALPGVSASGRS